MTREEKREKARAEAEAALIAETKEAKHRAMKGADMAKPMAAGAAAAQRFLFYII